MQQNGVAIALPTDGTATKLLFLDRGYTSHEHLSEVELIHMNGRLYDPVLRSFIMPENFIQQPENTQNYNRYAYVLNNPLMYTDPSGEAYENGYENPSETNQQFEGNIIASVINFFKDPENGEWFRRNAGEIGRFVGRNFESAFNDTSGWIGKQAKSIGKFFSNMFKKPTQFNESKVTSLNYAAVNTTNTISNSFTGGNTSASGGFKSHGDIHLPTQHSSLGFNWTYLSQGKILERFFYDSANSINIFGQYFMGRGIGDSSMRNLDGSATTTDQAVIAYVNTMSLSTLAIEKRGCQCH